MDKQGQVTKAQLALIEKFVNSLLTKAELEDFTDKTVYVISKRSKVKNYDTTID